MKVYGYARVSTRHQSLDRQIANIRAAYPDVSEIVTEKFTGTKLDRPAWSRLYKKLAAGDTIIFDEISRLARNAEEGFSTYRELFSRGVTMVFLKEPHINSDTYKASMEAQIPAIDVGGEEAEQELMDGIRDVLNRYIMRLAERQIKIAFEQAQNEVDHLHKRVSEGMRASGAAYQRNEAGEIIEGSESKIAKARTGNTYETKKSKEMKVRIVQMSRDFNGTMTDKDVMEVLGLARNSFYKYKRELIAAQDNDGNADE